MIIIALIFLFLIALCLTIIVGAITLQLFRMLLGEAPFLSTEEHSRKEVIDAIPLQPEGIFYDLGCGDARVLIACHQIEPNAKYIGIEKNIIPFLLAKWNLSRYHHGGAITLLRKDFFSVQYQNANIIYAYLFPDILDALFPKLREELRPGTPVITPSFRFSAKQPTQTIPLTQELRTKSLIREVFVTIF